MLLRRCENCNQVFSAQISGMMAVLCRPCAMDCDVAYLKIYKFIRDMQADNHELCIADMDRIAEGAKVPAVFVRVLYEEGRFSTKDQSTRQSCKRCGAELKEAEKDLCGNCGSNLSRAIHQSKLKYPPERTASPPPESAPPSPHPPRPLEGGGDDRHKYGLGR